MRTDMRRWNVGLVLAVAGLSVACEATPTGGDPTPEPPSPPGLLTSATRYQMLPWESPWGGHQVTIEYSFTNRTGGPVFLVGCGSDYSLKLERWTEGEWESAWNHYPNLCLSWEVVEVGETYSQEWLFFGPPPEVDNFIPTFDAQPGLYRIRWVKAYDHFSLTDVIEYGDLIDERHRISNTFELTF